MKKTTLLVACLSVMNLLLVGQTKQAGAAMKMDDPAFIAPHSVQHAIQPPANPLSISGYYSQDFESTTFPPVGWQSRNQQGTAVWARSTAQAHLSTASAFINYQYPGTGEDWLIMPRYQVTATTDSLVFWMRLLFAGYQPDSLCIKVSTTDSLLSSFSTTLLKLQEGLNYPSNTTTWVRYAVSVGAYNGQQIYLAFKHYDIDGDGLYIDDVKLGTPAANEVATTGVISPTATVGAGTIYPQATFINNGTVSQTFNVTTTITPGGYTSTTSVSSLAPNTSTTATFGGWTATPGTYTLKTYTQLPGDVNTLNDTITMSITVLNAFLQYGWDINTALPAGRWATAPVFVKPCRNSTDTGYVYLIAGADASFAATMLNTRYNTVTGTYSTAAAIPSAHLQVTPVAVNGKIYVIGGYSAGFTPTSVNHIYDVATNTWSTGAAMPTPSGDYAVGVYNDSLIYYVAGYSGSGDINTVRIYNTYTNSWTTGTPKTGTAVAGCRMGISGNKIVFVGGYSQTLATEISDVVYGIIDPNTPTTIAWTGIGQYPGGTVGRFGSTPAFQDNGLVYFAGGDPTGQGTQVVNSVYAYNTIAGQWETGPNMPVGVSNISGMAAAIHNDSLFIVTMGGYNGSSVVTSNHWLNIGPAAPLPVGPADVTMCNGSTTQLIAMNAVSYSWTPSASLDNATIANPISSATTTTTYTLTMGKGYGCPVIDPVTVTVNPLPTVVANSTATSVCAGTPVTLTGSGATSYTWTGSVTDNVAFTPAVTDTYTVTGTDANGCVNTDMITVTVNPIPTVVANATATTVCEGTPVTLSGSGAMSYTWTGSVTDNVAFTPVVTDTYTVTGTDANGCTNTDMITVTVNPLPTVVANSTATTVCDGSMVTLSGSGALTYSWTGSVTDNVAFMPMMTDTYTVTGTDANGCMDTDVVTVTWYPVPTVTITASDTSVCSPMAVTLSGNGAVSYTWTGNVTDNVPFFPTVTDTYTVTGTDSNGCTNTNSIMVTVTPGPIVVANATATTICEGSPVTLTGSGSANYTWTGGVTDNVPFNPIATDTYTVTGTDSSGCSGTDMITITVNPLPDVTAILPDTICQSDGIVTLAGGIPSGGTWSGPGVTGNTFDPSVSGLGVITLVYSFTDANGCSNSDTNSVVVDICAGIESIAITNSTLIPNPTNGQFTIQLATASATPVQVEITNGLGQVVTAFVMTGSSQQVDISTLGNGVYFVRLVSGDAVIVHRVVKN
jgi:hypothetical protein